MKDITQQLIRSLFKYDKGKLYWLKPKHGKISVGDEAGSFNKTLGYHQIFVDGHCHYRHRVVYLYHYGYLPKYLDHKYGKGIGDYLWNLRPCTHAENMANVKLNKNNNSGYKGVKWNEKPNTWTARITHNNKIHYLGTFDRCEDAVSVIESKRLELCGKFTNHGTAINH